MKSVFQVTRNEILQKLYDPVIKISYILIIYLFSLFIKHFNLYYKTLTIVYKVNISTSETLSHYHVVFLNDVYKSISEIV